MKMWYVYILQCSDQTLYTGITTDLDRRLQEHNTSRAGARYTASRRPVELVWSQTVASRSIASSLEYRIKRMSRQDKCELIA